MILDDIFFLFFAENMICHFMQIAPKETYFYMLSVESFTQHVNVAKSICICNEVKWPNFG